jgi:hypothetical protein
MGTELRERVTGTTDEVTERVSEIGGRLGDRVSGMADDTMESIRGVGTIVRQRTQAVDRDWIQERPLAVSAAALGFGLMIGLMAPPTRRERELIGDASDRVLERGREIVSTVGEQARTVVEQVGEVAGDEIGRLQQSPTHQETPTHTTTAGTDLSGGTVTHGGTSSIPGSSDPTGGSTDVPRTGDPGLERRAS